MGNETENLETSIRRHLMSYLADEMSLNDFHDWLIGATWHVDDVLEPERRPCKLSGTKTEN